MRVHTDCTDFTTTLGTAKCAQRCCLTYDGRTDEDERRRLKPVHVDDDDNDGGEDGGQQIAWRRNKENSLPSFE